LDERFNPLLLTSSTERWIRARAPLLVLAVLLCLGAANIASRATWHEVEDGVLWTDQERGCGCRRHRGLERPRNASG
jgi:hypothetical protein